jgi:transcriptional regulator
MFVPTDYQPRDPAWITELIRGNPLAILVTSVTGDWPIATHVPTFLENATDQGNLAGASVIGHMNRLNPHWHAIQGGGPAALLFHGPHGYISPTVYGICPAAPTWNFTAVHLRGSLSIVPSRDETLKVVKRTVTTYEESHGTGWDMTSSLGYFEQLLPGVGAFRLTVTKVDSMFKLSQEQRADVRERTIDTFETGGKADYKHLAELMRRAQ